MIVSERFLEATANVERFRDRLMKVVVAAEHRMHNFLCTHRGQDALRELKMSFGPA